MSLLGTKNRVKFFSRNLKQGWLQGLNTLKLGKRPRGGERYNTVSWTGRYAARHGICFETP